MEINYSIELSPRELLHRVGNITKALFMGYPFKCSNGMMLQLNEDGTPYLICKDNEDKEVFVKAGFEVDTCFLYKEAKKLSDSAYCNLTSFLTLNEFRYVTTRTYKIDYKKDILLYNLLPSLKITVTRAETKRLIYENGIEINHKPMCDVEFLVTSEMLKKGITVTIGKRREYLIVA